MRICIIEGCTNEVRIRKDGSIKDAKCNVCIGNMSKYNITTPERDSILERQNGKCKICRSTLVFGRTQDVEGKHRGCVDHCHRTGKVRGILCSMCNVALGGFFDDTHLLKEAISYLEESRDG